MKRFWNFLRGRRDEPRWSLNPDQGRVLPGVTQTPPVDRILGVGRPDGFDYPAMTVTVAYIGPNKSEHHLEMPFLEAMALLNYLRVMQQDVGFYMPEDPHRPR